MDDFSQKGKGWEKMDAKLKRHGGRTEGDRPRGRSVRRVIVGVLALVLVGVVLTGAITGILAGRRNSAGTNGVVSPRLSSTSNETGPAREAPPPSPPGDRAPRPQAVTPSEDQKAALRSTTETDARGRSNRTEAVIAGQGDVSTPDKIIKTAQLVLQIKSGEFEGKYDEVSAIAEGAGGWVSESKAGASGSGGTVTGGTVTIRVPSASFSRALAKIKDLGKVESISEETTDVSEEYTDLTSRLNHLRAQESVYLSLMARAQTIEESLAVQRELSALQQETERLQGRKNYLDNRVDYSNIQVTLNEPGSSATVARGRGWGVGGAFADAAHGVVNAFNAIVRFAGVSLVYILLVAAVAAVCYLVVKKFFMQKGSDTSQEAGD